MRTQRAVVAATGVALALVVAACGGGDDRRGHRRDAGAGGTDESAEPAPEDSESEPAAGGGAEGGTVGVILPDTASSARWESADRPFLQEAFDAAGMTADIQNANGDTAAFQTIADGMINAGVDALLIVNLDSETGTAVISDAAAAGIPVIDYDRLTARRRRRLLRVLRQRGRRHHHRRGPGDLPAGRGHDRGRRRPPERLADRQQRHAVQAGLPGRHRGRRVRHRRRPGRAGLGQHPGGHDLRADLHQHRRRASSVSRRPTTASAARRSPSSSATSSPARSRSPARTPPTRACSASCSAPSA